MLPHAPGGAGGGGTGSGRSQRRTRYEKGDPQLFVDHRARARPVIGQPPTAPRRVDAGPGVIGNPKQKPAEHDQAEQQLPKPTQTPAAAEGFPDKLKDGTFTRRDGARFTVRRRSGS